MESLNKMKRQRTEWEKILQMKIFAADKGLISKVYKHPLQLNTKTKKKTKSKQPHQKIGKRSKQIILQRRRTHGQKTHEKMFNITH